MRIILIFLVSLLLVGCDSFRTIHVEVKSESTVQDGGLLGSSWTALGFSDFASFDVSSSAEFENNDATRNNIGESYVTKFTLKVIDPEGNTLSFIESMEVYIGDGDDRTRVAYLDDDQDTDVAELSLRVNDEYEIGQYLRAEKAKITVEARGQPPEEDTTIEATMGFRIQLVF